MKKSLMAVLTGMTVATMFMTGCDNAAGTDRAANGVSVSEDMATSVESASTFVDIQSGGSASDQSAPKEYKDAQVFKAYAEYLKNNALTDSDKAGDYHINGSATVYTIEYIDDDDIPELVIGGISGIHASNIYILSYKDEEVLKYGPFGAYNATSFYPKKNLIMTSDAGMDTDGRYYSKLNSDGTYTSLFYDEAYLDEDGVTELEHHYYIAEDEVSEDEYEKAVDEAVDGAERKCWYGYENENGYRELDDNVVEALENKVAYFDAGFDIDEDSDFVKKYFEITDKACTAATEMPENLDMDTFVAYVSYEGVEDVDYSEYMVYADNGKLKASGAYTECGDRILKSGKAVDEESFLSLLSSLEIVDVEFDDSGLTGSGWFGSYGTLYFMQDGELYYCYTYNIF